MRKSAAQPSPERAQSSSANRNILKGVPSNELEICAVGDRPHISPPHLRGLSSSTRNNVRGAPPPRCQPPTGSSSFAWLQSARWVKHTHTHSLRMQRRGDSAAATAAAVSSTKTTTPRFQTSIQTEEIMTARGRRPRGGPRRWRLLTPTVLWSVVILAMAPSFYGFTGSRGGGFFPTGRWAGRSGAGGVAAADLASATAAAAGGTKGRRGGGGGAEPTGGAKGSPFAAASWLKDRVRDGKRRVHMQVRVRRAYSTTAG